ncbi:MAG: antitoxin component YwqK of YwqJK toxin-antitoxin module [Crocinitomix sp.]|jgi:antitoxin component YwqK of YwqJK toxin-antitoxin module
MKIFALPLFLLIFSVNPTFGQSDSATVYKSLKTKKHYSVQLSSETGGVKSVYKVNDKSVRKSTYEKYEHSWKNMVNCTPCILNTYDIDENLLTERVAYQDCGVGWFKSYHTNGNLKVTGFFKENTTGNWENLYDREFCSIKNSQWNYFNKDGDTLYSEFWEDGQFIKQVPEQEKVEIWNLEFYLDNKIIEKEEIALNRINDIEFRPQYKNNQKDSNFTIKASVSIVGYKMVTAEFDKTTFTVSNINKLFEDAGVPVGERTRLDVTVYLRDTFLNSTILRLKE